MSGSKIAEHREIGRCDGYRGAAVGRAEVGREVDEIGNGDRSVVIHVAFLPGGVGPRFAEMGCEVDEVRDGDGAVEIQIADAGGTNQKSIRTSGRLDERHADRRILAAHAGVEDAIAGIGAGASDSSLIIGLHDFIPILRGGIFKSPHAAEAVWWTVEIEALIS